ncbi:MAG TPA: NAD(P)(+) transhydrogenase (Re/Si-specific) subunit alpha, partial [Alphaproteobacteria bacterium]|nr:NAD(P)(+) transhydrogenase (Re/Si-specific) subunit alpha [Alphaproteobacteria bacterium]
MIIGAPKEIAVDEKRVAMTPDSATQLQKLGYDCLIQSGAGLHAGFSDAAYEKAGVKIAKTAEELWQAADIISKVRPPETAEVKFLKKGKLLISFFYPAQNTDQMALIAKQDANV